MSNIAFVFPGQGSQVVGMLSEFSKENHLILTTFSEASEVLGYDLWELVQEDAEQKLNQTEYTQPALLAASIALWRIWESNAGAKPHCVAGHSLGEYSALVASGVLEFQDAIQLVRKRGQYMQNAVPVGEGGMAAILGLDDDQVIAVCEQSSAESGGGTVQAANFNSPGQVVIAGHKAALEIAIEACKQAGARKAMQLMVSAPFHSAMMKPAAEQLAKELDKVQFRPPEFSIIQNVHAKIESNPDSIRQNLVTQMYGAVKWTETVKLLSATGIEKVVECGPGKVLKGLIKRTAKDIESYVISDSASMDDTLNKLS